MVETTLCIKGENENMCDVCSNTTQINNYKRLHNVNGRDISPTKNENFFFQIISQKNQKKKKSQKPKNQKTKKKKNKKQKNKTKQTNKHNQSLLIKPILSNLNTVNVVILVRNVKYISI